MTRATTRLAGLALSMMGAVTSSACGAADDQLFDHASSMSQSSTTSLANDYPEAALIDAISGENEVACSGTVIAPQVVLTSAMCLHRFGTWRVTVPFAKNPPILATKAAVLDWTPSNPDRHNVGVIFLPSRIELPAYPTLATAPVADGSPAVQLGRVANGVVSKSEAFVGPEISLRSGADIGLADDYVSEGSLAFGNQGGGVELADHELVAINSTGYDGLVTMTRVDLVATWLLEQIASVAESTNDAEWIDMTKDAGACKDNPGAPCGWTAANNSQGYTCAERHPEWQNGWTCESW